MGLRLLAAGAVVILSGSAFAAKPGTYYDGIDTSSSAALRSDLETLLSTGFDQVTYANAWDALKAIDEDAGDSTRVLLMYTGDSRLKTEQCGGPGCENSNPETGEWTREHLWPQSSFNGDEPSYSDIHALFPCDQDVNNARGNLPFDYVTTTPDYTTPSGAKRGGGVFEPPDADKGRVARALLYMDVRYFGGTGEFDLVLEDSHTPVSGAGRMGNLTTLLEWHNAFPPDAAEIARNDAAYCLPPPRPATEQGNANPFIDNPGWADIVWAVSDGDTLSVGSTDRAPATAAPGSEVPMLTLTLTASGNEYDLESVVLNNNGTADDSEAGEIRMYIDAGNDGTVTTADPLIMTDAFSGGTVTFDLRNQRIGTSGRNLLFTLATDGSIDAGDTVAIQVAASSIVQSATSGGADTAPVFSAIDSGTTTIAGAGSGEVIVSEIMYNPNSNETGAVEWIEIFNTSTSNNAVMTNWTIKDEDGAGGTFSMTLTPLEAGVLIPSGMAVVDFQAAWGATFQIAQVTGFPSLANSPAPGNEVIELLDGSLVSVDTVDYDDAAPWPSDSPDGPSVYLLDPFFDSTSNDNGANWARSQAAVDGAFVNTVTLLFDGTDTGSPGVVAAPSLPVALDAFVIE